MSEPDPQDRHGQDRFPTTQWTRIAAAADPSDTEAQEALADLCRDYWYPVYAFVRRKGHNPDAAADLTQEYFARLLENGVLAKADRTKGRFRAFLRTDCGFFLADQEDRARAIKRGGRARVLSIDRHDAEGRYLLEPVDTTSPDRLFDRAWGLTLLDQVLDGLAHEYQQWGKAELFARLRIVLTDGPGAVPYAAIAQEFAMTEGAVQAAVQRLRKRYRNLLREQIAATLHQPDAESIEDEIRELFEALRG